MKTTKTCGQRNYGDINAVNMITTKSGQVSLAILISLLQEKKFSGQLYCGTGYKWTSYSRSKLSLSTTIIQLVRNNSSR